jgi:hypothetical protein
MLSQLLLLQLGAEELDIMDDSTNTIETGPQDIAEVYTRVIWCA